MPRVDRAAAQGGLRVLAVVDLGGNWGHLFKIRPILDLLRQRGHRGSVATPYPDAAKRLFADGAAEVFACPSLNRTHRVPAGLRFKSYVQILEHCAFGSEGVLASNLRQWMALIDRARPDVLLVDFSPLALLVARLRGIPAVQVATGWEAPPAGAPLPMIAPVEGDEPPRHAAAEARLLARLNRHCVAHGAARMEKVSDLFAERGQLLCTWPEMDHFGPREGARYVGPLYSADQGRDVEWRDAPPSPGRVFVYLAADPRNVALIEALCRFDIDVVAVLPGVSPDATRHLEASGARVFATAARIDAFLPAATLVISNGGHGLTGACLAAGVPMLLLPRSAEQATIAGRVAGAGLARRFDAAETFDAAIDGALRDETCRAAARTLAARYAHWTVGAALDAVADEVERTGRVFSR